MRPSGGTIVTEGRMAAGTSFTEVFCAGESPPRRDRMPAFPSTEWAALFQKALNDNPAYAQAAAAWEGDILFEVLPDPQTSGGPGIYLDLAHGTCREARFVSDPSTVNPEFVFRATRENWQKILRRDLDPVKAFLGGTIRMSGNPAKIMRFVGAAKELIETAAGVPTS